MTDHLFFPASVDAGMSRLMDAGNRLEVMYGLSNGELSFDLRWLLKVRSRSNPKNF